MKRKTMLYTVFVATILLFSVFVLTPHLQPTCGGYNPEVGRPITPSGSTSGLGASVDISYEPPDKITNLDWGTITGKHDSIPYMAYDVANTMHDDGVGYLVRVACADEIDVKWHFEFDSLYTDTNNVEYEFNLAVSSGSPSVINLILYLYTADGARNQIFARTSIGTSDSSTTNLGVINGKVYGYIKLYGYDAGPGDLVLQVSIDELRLTYNTISEIRRSEYSVAGGTVRNKISWQTWDYNVETTLTVPASWTFQDVNPDAAESSDVFTCLVPKQYEAVYTSTVEATANWDQEWAWSFEGDGNEYVKVMDGAASYNLTSTTYNFTESWTDEAWIVWSSYGSATLDYTASDSVTAGTSGEWTTTLTNTTSISYLNFSGTNVLIDGVAVYNSSVATGSTTTGTLRNIHPNGYVLAAFSEVNTGLWSANGAWMANDTKTTDSIGAWSKSSWSLSQWALDFDGTNDQVDVADDNSLDVTSITYELWIRPLEAETQYIISKWGASGYRGCWALSIEATRKLYIQMDISGVHKSFYSATAITLGNWVHVAVTWSSGETQKVYLNGSLDGQSGTVLSGALDTSSEKLTIGRRETGPLWFNGSISHIRVYDRSLDAVEVAANYADSYEPVNSGLVLWLPLDEGIGTTVADDSGEGNDGTVAGATWEIHNGLPCARTSLIAQTYTLVTWTDSIGVNSTNTLAYPFSAPPDWSLTGSFSFSDYYGWASVDSTYDVSYLVYENDVSVAAGSIDKNGDNIRWTLQTSPGNYSVGIKFTYGSMSGSKWLNTSYTVSSDPPLAVVDSGYRTDEFRVYVWLTTNWRNTTITIIDEYDGTNYTKFSGVAEGIYDYSIQDEAGEHIVYVLVDGGAESLTRTFVYEWKWEITNPPPVGPGPLTLAFLTFNSAVTIGVGVIVVIAIIAIIKRGGKGKSEEEGEAEGEGKEKAGKPARKLTPDERYDQPGQRYDRVTESGS